MRFSRFLALGDSFTEGMSDEIIAGQYRGWADRIADVFAAENSDFTYANFAIRGKLLHQVVADQVPLIFPLITGPETLVSFHAGANDALRPNYKASIVLPLYAETVRKIAKTGATILLFTVLEKTSDSKGKTAQMWQERFGEFNRNVRAVAAEVGAIVADANEEGFLSDLRFLAKDRLHLNSEGHYRSAQAILEKLDYPFDLQWRTPLPTAEKKGFYRRSIEWWRWFITFLIPWIWRRLRGVSSGDGRSAKHYRPMKWLNHESSQLPSSVHAPLSKSSDPKSMDLSAYLTDRELSWLSFNERVLELAEDTSVPLLERVRFLSIFSSNLDEFYMVRVATLMRKLETGITAKNSAGFTPQELLKEIALKTRSLMERQSTTFVSDILPKLNNNGIEILRWNELEESEVMYLTNFFEDRIFPVLTPLAVDPSHPFPYISGLSLNLGVIVQNPERKEQFFARIKVPPTFSRFIPTDPNKQGRFIPLEEVISHHLSKLFPGMKILDHYTFRLTRNQDLEFEDEETEDLLSSLEQELLRRRFGPPTRLEIEAGISPDLLSRLQSELEIDPENILHVKFPIDLTDLNRIADLDIPELKFVPYRAKIPAALANIDFEENEPFFAAIRTGEILLHHPYESFTSSVVQFLETAARDPQVLAIKQTLYRTSGDSPIIEALIEAAEAGKQVLAVIEIRARFDEQANVRWARKLEAAGVHVVYGLMGLKTHAKLSLVIRDEPEGLRRYCHVGTGNYNPKTARAYEDFGLLSCDPTLGEDLTKIFNQLSGFAPLSDYSRLLVAPRTLRDGLLEKIDKEIANHKAGKPAGIQLKLNSLLDEAFVEKLYEASQNGVSVDLLIRGICALRPGIPGKSENIRVRSILGRFLEHSRIFHFVNAGDNEYWIGSADLMHRNLDRRVESLVRIAKPDHEKYLQGILDLGLSDSTMSWELTGNTWKKRLGENLANLHETLITRFSNRG